MKKGESIKEVGEKNDKEVEESSEAFAINTDTDNQLNFAVKLFNG